MSTTPETKNVAEAAPEDQALVAADLQDERLIGGQKGVVGWIRSFANRQRSGDLGSLPVIIGLVLIWVVFQLLNPAFLSSRNLVNLTLQCAAVGTIAIGVVLVLLLGEIDLSIGSVSGLSAAVVVVTFVQLRWPLALAILAAIASGALVGFIYGMIFNRFGVPSFVITLAGLLGFLGLQLAVLGKDGSISIPFKSPLVKFSLTFLPNWLSWVLLVVVVGLFLSSRLRLNQLRARAGLSTTPVLSIVIRTALLAALLAVALYALVLDRGLSIMVLVFLILVVIFDFLIRRTRWGRSVFAVGGSVEAARRAGIDVKRIYLTVFMLCSALAAIGGIFAAARLGSANQSSGGGDVNLNAIAAAVIGGTSLFGGRGSAYSALLGVIVLQSIASGLALMNLDSKVQYMVTGAVLLLAVTIDSLSRRARVAAGRA